MERTSAQSPVTPKIGAAKIVAPDVVNRSDADRVAQLENIVFAQKWDLAGLTEQRDQAMEQVCQLEDERAVLRCDLARLRSDMKARHAELQLSEQVLSARSAVAISATRITADIAAELVLLGHRGGDPGQPSGALSAAAISEVLLLQASGLFDHDFYLRQIDEPLTLTAALCHYVLAGEAAGLLANPLFDLECYKIAAQRADAPLLDHFSSCLVHYAAIGAGMGLSPGPLVDRAFCLAQIDPADHPVFEPVSYYLQVGRFVGFTPHPLIDKAYYLQVRGGLGVGEDPLADYRLVGCQQNLSLHPLFDAAWYLETNDDVRDTGCDPLRHYLAFGDAEGRWPNPLFDPAMYREHTDPFPAGMPTLTHYVLSGRDGARSHLLFDGVWYLRRNPDVGLIGMDPLTHYLGPGSAERRSPHPLFDTEYLLERYPALLRHHRSPLIAFLRSRAHETGSAHPLFDPRHYVAQVPEAADWPDGIFAHFLRFGEINDADPHPLFCTRYYREQLSLLGDGAAGAGLAGGTASNPLAHFLAIGGDRGCRPHPLFDPVFYLENNSDVRGSGINPLVHFMNSGGTRRERRQPHMLFDIALYAERLATLSPDLVDDSTNLLLDFVVNWRARPSPHILFDVTHYAGQEIDEPRHPNPLADYVWKARAAVRAPHRLFDPAYYLASIEVPATWRRSLLEHYAAKLAPEEFLPHPSLDGEYVTAQIGDEPAGNLTLLEHFVTRAKQRDLGPQVRFASRDHALLHPDLDAGPDDQFTAYLNRGGQPTWLPAPATPHAAPLAYEAEKAALCGIGGVAPVSPALARGRAMRHRMASREVTDGASRVTGTLPPHAGAAPGKLAIYAAWAGVAPSFSAGTAAAGLHDHALAALAQAGFKILFVEGALGDLPAPTARRHVQATLSHSLGSQHIGAWVLACRQFAESIASYDQVLFLSDNLVGPIGSPTALFASLASCTTGWWGATHADQSSGAIDCEIIALSGAVIAGAAFQGFLAGFRFADTAARMIEPSEYELSRALRASGLTPSLLANAGDLRAGWLHGMSATLRWFRDLGEPASHGPEAADADLQARIAAYAETWLRARIQDPNFGGRVRPGLLFWDTLLTNHHFPFLRRDLLLANPINDPSLLRLRDLLGVEDLALLHRLLAPTLPAPATLPHPPVLRLGLRAATPFTTVTLAAAAPSSKTPPAVPPRGKTPRPVAPADLLDRQLPETAA